MDTSYQHLRAILVNQAGAFAPEWNDTRYELVRKIAQNAGASPSFGDSEYDLWEKIRDIASDESFFGETISDLIADIAGLPGASEHDALQALEANGLSGGGGGGGGPPEDPTVAAGYYHILITGQSNAVAAGAAPVLTLTSPARALMFSGGIYPGSGSGLDSLIPLQEAVQDPILGETICSAVAKQLGPIGPNAFFIFSMTGADGKRYDELKKGTSYYTASLAHVTAAKNAAALAGLPYRVVAVCAIHGETDQEFSKTDYQANLAIWQSDYQSDIQAINGQSESIPLIACQQCGYAPDNGNSNGYVASTALQLEQASAADPTHVMALTPRFMLDHPDGLHFTNWSQRWLGEYYGKAMKKLLLGESFRAVSPASAVLIGNTITIDFNVAAGCTPLQWDTRFVLYQPNYGFTYSDDVGTITITNVAITGPARVEITLSGSPGAINPVIKYGCDHYAINAPKFGGGKGNLADSDPAASSYGLPLHNHALSFRRFL